MPEARRRAGLLLILWQILTFAAAPLLRYHLQKRLARGKELPDRWQEKLGMAGLPRPEGRIVWLHAVGLGEVLASRGLILNMASKDPELEFLVTSGTRASAEVLARNMPPRSRHQFLPLDSPRFAARFLNHWRPDLSIWSEQDLWPGLVLQTDRRGIPLALVNARMNTRAFQSRRRIRPLFRDIYRRFAMISAQDAESAHHIRLLGARVPEMPICSLKPTAPALADNPQDRIKIQAQLSGRHVWLAASTHPEDEAMVLAAHAKLRLRENSALLILVPRLPERGAEIVSACVEAGFSVGRRSLGHMITPEMSVYLADTYGEMGLWYRLVNAVFVGGSMGAVQGHNPWEAAKLGVAILHGPNTGNFKTDFADLHACDAARQIDTPDALARALRNPALQGMGMRGQQLTHTRMEGLDELCQKLRILLNSSGQHGH